MFMVLRAAKTFLDISFISTSMLIIARSDKLLGIYTDRCDA